VSKPIRKFIQAFGSVVGLTCLEMYQKQNCRHEGEIRILDARMVQDACEWALQGLQAGIDAGLAYVYQRLVDVVAWGRQTLVQGVLGGLWLGLAWLGRSVWGIVELIVHGIGALIVSLWTIVTTTIHFALHVVLTIARAAIAVVLGILRETGNFVLWLIGRLARGVAGTIAGAVGALVGGVGAFGLWMKESAVALRAAIYRLVLDVLFSIRAFFVDVGHSIWEFGVDTAMATRQLGLDTAAAVTASARSAMYVFEDAWVYVLWSMHANFSLG
jgi:hypothetical protein